MSRCITIKHIVKLLVAVLFAVSFQVESFVPSPFVPLSRFESRSTEKRSRPVQHTTRPSGSGGQSNAATAALLFFGSQFFLGPPSLSSPLGVLKPPVVRAEVAASSTGVTSPLVEEGWGLLSKFYVDKTFNGQDWDAARTAANDKALKKGEFRALDDLTKSLGDKYTRVVTKDSYSKLARFDLVGAGVLFAPNDAGHMSIASPPMPGSSGFAAGLHKGDLVLSINGLPTDGMTSFDVIDNVMDDDGRTKLDLKVQAVGSSDANKEVRDVSLTRSVTTLSDPVSYRIMDGTHTGYIKLSEFNARCPTRVREAVEDLQKQGAQRYILDLRGNPGGTFQTAAKIAGIFMSDRLVTTVADSAGAKTEFRTEEDSQAKKQGERSHQAVIDAPLALWVDRGSASASEVLAGALHDNCRAVVAGDRTFGKGLIQGVFGLEDGSGLIITVARYLTPGGVDINGAGVQPDIARDLGLNFLGGVINVDQDLTEPEWALAQERQGGKLCPPNSEVQVLAAVAGLGQSTGR